MNTTVNTIPTDAVPKAVRFMMLTLLIVPTHYMDVAVDALECDLRAAPSNAHGREPVVPVDEFSVAPLRDRRSARQHGHVEIGIEAAVESLHAQIGREIPRKHDLDRAVDRPERRRRLWIRGEP